MPFFEPIKINKFELDEQHYMRIAVLWCTEIDGKITPLLFKYQEKDQTIVTVKIDAVRSRKLIKYGISFVCSVTAYGVQKLVTIICYTSELIWVMPKL